MLLHRQGEEWKDLRSKTQKHLMKPRAVQAYLNPMQDVARDFVVKMLKVRDGNKEVPNFLEELYKWALECKWLVESFCSIFILLEKLVFFSTTVTTAVKQQNCQTLYDISCVSFPLNIE